MKKLIVKLLNKAKEFLLWVWHECKDWKTLILLAVVCLVVGLPVWGGYLLALLFHWEWAFWVASVCLGFWWLPGAPYFALCVSITLVIKRCYEKVARKRRERRECLENPENSGELGNPEETVADQAQTETESDAS